MTRPALKARDARALRTGLLILAPLLAVKLLVLPFVHALGAAHDQLDTERGLLRRELALLDDTKRYPVVLKAAEGRAKAEIPRLFRGADELSATAALSYYASEQARRSRVLVQQIDARPAAPAGGGLRRLEVSLRVQSDLEGVLSWFDALERGPRLVRLEQITIERSVSSATWESLDVSCTLVGYAALAEPQGAATAAVPDGPRGAGE